MSGDGDIFLGWLFGGDGSHEDGVVASIWWLGDGVVIGGTVVEV